MRKKKQKIKDIINGFGKATSKERVISNINMFYRLNEDGIKLIDDKTWNDLEMNNIFEFLDRTYSKTGEQYFYNLLHKKMQHENNVFFNLKVDHYQSNFDKCLNNILVLQKYNKLSSYTLPSLLYGKRYYKIPRWITWLGYLAVLIGILTLIESGFFIPFIGIGFINTLLHYYYKQKIISYYHDFSNLKSFYSIYNKLIKNDDKNNLLTKHENKKLKSISNRCRFLTMNIDYADELTAALYYLIEILKGWFLIDVMQFNNTLKVIKNNAPLLRKVFNYIGLVDTAISVVAVKKGTQGCAPLISTNNELSLKNTYHPLIDNCVKNSLSMYSDNAIITGGNMSGKTTFLKTIGINVLLAQTINYAFAEEIKLPELQILSSVTNEDNLGKGQSYFMSELIRAQNLLEKNESSKLNHLLLFDEIFKGTNTYDRISLGASVLNYFCKSNTFVVATTHDIAIMDYVETKYKPFYFDHQSKDNKIVFDYKIRKGVQKKSNVIELIKSLKFKHQIVTNTMRIKEHIKKAHNSGS